MTDGPSTSGKVSGLLEGVLPDGRLLALECPSMESCSYGVKFLDGLAAVMRYAVAAMVIPDPSPGKVFIQVQFSEVLESL